MLENDVSQVIITHYISTMFWCKSYSDIDTD